VRAALRAIAALGLLGAAACSQTFDATSLGVPATMSVAPGEAAQGTPFSVHAHTVHAFLGLVTLSQAKLQKALASELVGGAQITQLRIRTKSRPWDLIVTGLTLGLIIPRTVIYDGVVIGR
jgi:hypothetical protein